MKLIKSRGLLIGKEKFQLIGPAGQKSREINLKQTSKKKIAYTSERAIRKGIDSIWAGGHTGTESSIKMDFAKKTHKKFIHLLNLNTKEKKNVLIIGPGHGFEAKYITENIPDVTIDTFDIVREISKEYKKYISKKGIHVNVGGLENYNNRGSGAIVWVIGSLLFVLILIVTFMLGRKSCYYFEHKKSCVCKNNDHHGGH